MKILKIKDWLIHGNEQFEPIEVRPLAPGITKSGKDYFIEKARRLKDDMIVERGLVHKYTKQTYYHNSKEIWGVFISKFDYDLIHVEVELMFMQNYGMVKHKDTIPNATLKIEMNKLYESIEEAVYQIKTDNGNIEDKGLA